MRNVTGRREAFRIFARQTAILAFVATVVFWALYAADYVLCANGHCAPLAERLPGLDNGAVVEVKACPP